MLKHYSASQINQYLRCPAQWAFRYVDNLISPPSTALVCGSSYHKGLEVNYKQKVGSKKDLSLSDVKDAASTEFDARISEVEATADDKGEAKDTTLGLVECYHKELAPTIQPLMVEKEINIHFDNVDYYIVGYVDLIDDKGTVRENKTTAKTPSTVSQDHLTQGTIYAISEGVSSVTYDYAVKNKTPKVVTLTAEISDQEKNFTLGLMGNIHHAIQNEVFYPNRTNFMCSRKQCGYWNHCEKKHGGRVKD